MQQRTTLGELSTPFIKYVVWSADMNHVALLSKHAIIIANKKLGNASTGRGSSCARAVWELTLGHSFSRVTCSNSSRRSTWDVSVLRVERIASRNCFLLAVSLGTQEVTTAYLAVALDIHKRLKRLASILYMLT